MAALHSLFLQEARVLSFSLRCIIHIGMLEKIKIKGLLSFRDIDLKLKPLNVLIGPNTAGKSNLIEIVSLLQALPNDFKSHMRRGTGAKEWFWKGEPSRNNTAELEVVFPIPDWEKSWHYLLRIGLEDTYIEILEERMVYDLQLENGEPCERFNIKNGRGHIYDGIEKKRLDISTNRLESMLLSRRDPDRYRELTYLATNFNGIKFYREWNLGRQSPARMPQPADSPNDFLEEDQSNLALILNRMNTYGSLSKIENYLKRFHPNFERFDIRIVGGTVQLYIREKEMRSWIPATRLSDGTLRYLSLLVVLCHPKPPPLICIEEPELGLHPDIIPDLAKLFIEASERTQLIVTTHSKEFIDALSGYPEFVVVCERDFDGATEFKRLERKELDEWLESYTLGQLWEKGEIGGNRY